MVFQSIGDVGGKSVKAGKSGDSSGGRAGRRPAGKASAKASDKVDGTADGQAVRESDVGIADQAGSMGRVPDRGRVPDPVVETAVLLDTVIHDLRTPLSAMSGWLEVLEAHFGEADGLVGRALLGLRRGVDSQTKGLNGLSDVLMKQRIDLPAEGECLLLERLQFALQQMSLREDLPLDNAELGRLAPFRSLDPRSSFTCKDAGSSLVDACATLLHALAVSQAGADAAMSITGSADKLLITVPGGSGDRTPLKSLCHGLEGYTTRRPEIRAQALWLARAVLQRCGLVVQMSPAGGGGFNLLLSRAFMPRA